MGVEFSCTVTEVQNLPEALPPQKKTSTSPSLSGSDSKDNTHSPREGPDFEFPQASMRKGSEETLSSVSEIRALSRMFSSQKHNYSEARRVCSLLPTNPFQVVQSPVDRSRDTPSIDGSIRAGGLESRYQTQSPSVRTEYDYHSPPKWFSEFTETISLVSLNETSPRFISITERIKKTLDVSVTKIEKVRNFPLYRTFADKHEDYSRMEGASQQILLLFYGTGKYDPYTLCTNLTGLDSPCIQCFNQPMTCFTDTAKGSYKFSFRRKDGSRQLLLCLVTVGEPVELQPDEDMSEPPARLDRTAPVLAATIKKKKTGVWIVYERQMSYPAYVVTVKEAEKK